MEANRNAVNASAGGRAGPRQRMPTFGRVVFRRMSWSPDWRVLIRRRTRGLWRQSPFYGLRAYGVTSASTFLLTPPPKHSAMAPNTPFPCPRNGYFLVRTEKRPVSCPDNGYFLARTEKRPVLCPSRAGSAEARFGMHKGDNVHQLMKLSLIKHRVLDLVRFLDFARNEKKERAQSSFSPFSFSISVCRTVKSVTSTISSLTL